MSIMGCGRLVGKSGNNGGRVGNESGKISIISWEVFTICFIRSIAFLTNNSVGRVLYGVSYSHLKISNQEV
jgi:hypothetical protein